MDSDLISFLDTFCSVKDGFNGIVGNKFSRRFSPFEVKVDVVDGIIEGKADQVMGICNTLIQRFVLRRSYSGGEPVRSDKIKEKIGRAHV